jgi:hypothetical protein
MREIRPYGSVRGVRRKPYPYRDNVHPVRSTAVAQPPLWRADHALDPATEDAEVLPLAAPFAGFFRGCSVASVPGARRTRNVGVIRCASEDLRNS